MEWNELTVFVFIMTIATFEGIIIKYTHFKKITKYPEENRPQLATLFVKSKLIKCFAVTVNTPV